MKVIFRQPQIYRFLSYCEQYDLEKVILDCGAGGDRPPLALFSEYGYKTYGIEISDSQIEKADEFAKLHGFKLNISKGDMRRLPFDDESISYVYSYNSIFHMRKEDIKKSLNELKRVLKPGGLCCVNFLSKEDGDYGAGRKEGEDEFWQEEHGGEVIHAYYELDEAEKNFDGMEVLFKEHRVLERIYEDRKIKQAYIDYIIRKK
jgi:ubiquinone/menaquinone biosynthesis C-methylase UbiE